MRRQVRMDSQKTVSRKWNKKEVQRQIQELNSLSARTCQRTSPALYGAAVRHYGSWKNAVESAGFNYKQVLKRKPSGYWNKERILAEIQRLRNKSSGNVRQNNPPLYSAAIRLFTSWKKAVELAKT